MKTLSRSDVIHARSVPIRIEGKLLVELIEREGVDGRMVVLDSAIEQHDGTFDLVIRSVVPGAGPDYPTKPADR